MRSRTSLCTVPRLCYAVCRACHDALDPARPQDGFASWAAPVLPPVFGLWSPTLHPKKRCLSRRKLPCRGQPVKTAQRQGRRTQLSRRALSARFDLLERDAELAAAEALISAGPSGGRLLAIEGPPGIGKTSLLMVTKARGQAAGMRVLAARGSELERAFSYGVVRQLFESFLASLPPDERAGALAGAGAL